MTTSRLILSFLVAATPAMAGEVWRSTFESGSDGLVNITIPNAALLPKIASVSGGRLTVNNYDQLGGMAANKAGRPLGGVYGGGNDFSALCQFRWAELWPHELIAGFGAFDLFAAMGDSDSDFTHQTLGAALNHYRDASGNQWLRLAVGVGAGGSGSGEWWFSSADWVNLGPTLLGRELQLTVSYAGSGVRKTMDLRLYDDLGVLLARQDIDLGSASCPAHSFIDKLALTHLGWTDYTGIGPNAGQSIPSRWEVDTLAFFNTSSGAAMALGHAGDVPPVWTSDRHHRLVVDVPAVTIQRTSDELVAALDVDFREYLGQQLVDLSSLQVVRYAADTGLALPYAANTYASTAGDRPFRFYDDAVPWDYPDRSGNASDTGGSATPVVNMEGGGRYFNPVGNAHAGRLAWVHTQTGTQASRYAIYFNGLPGNTPVRQASAGFIGDGVNRCTLGAAQFAPVIHGRIDLADLNGDGLPDVVLGNATGTILWYPNVGKPNIPSFQYAKLVMMDDGTPLDVGWSAAPKVVDWDGDGELDLMVGAEMAGVVLYFRNVGTGSVPLFHRVGLLTADGRPISTPSAPCEEDPTNAIFARDYYPVPEIVDFDGDGDLDLLLGGYITGKVFYYQNIGSSHSPALTFRGPLQAVPPEGGAPRSIDVTWCAAPCMADFDGDGDLDLISGAMQMTSTIGDLSDPERFLWYYENVGTRTAPQLVWRPFPKSGSFVFGLLGTPRAIDFNGDGKLDLVVSTMGSLLMLPNIGTVSKPLYNAATLQLGLPWGNSPLSFSQLVDFNGDGWPDLFTGYTIQLNTGLGAPGIFGASVALPGATQIYHPNPSGDAWDYRTFADLDHDGQRDIEVGDHQGYVWFHRDSGTAGHPQIDPAGVQLSLTTGDHLRVGTTEGGAFDQLQGARTVQTVGDFNHDSWPDLAVGDTYGYIRVFLRVPGEATVFLPGIVVARPVATRVSIQAVDWDNDGWDDLLASYASSTGDLNYALLNQAQPGVAAFAAPAILPLAAAWGWPMLFVGDWNRDGDTDLLIDQYGYTRYVERSFIEHGYIPAAVMTHEAKNTTIPTGACCHEDGTCSTTDAFSCAGHWAGADVSCGQADCPQPGACCLSDGSCAQTIETTCPGSWAGAGTSCETATCPQPGACCLADGTCVDLLQSACQGEWMGTGSKCAASHCDALTGEVWRADFDGGTDGVTTFMTGQTNPPHQPIGPVTSGLLQVTTWDFNPADSNVYLPYKSGRSLGNSLGGADSFSGLYMFRWSSLQANAMKASEFVGFMGDTWPYQTRPVCGALLRHYKSGPNYWVDLGIGFGTVGATWFGEMYGPSINLGSSIGQSTYQLAVGYNGTTHVLSVGLLDANGNTLGRFDPDLDTDVPALQSPGLPADEISALAVNHLGWMDYRSSGGNLATVWQVDTLVYFDRAYGAFVEAKNPRRAPVDFNRDGHVDATDLAHFTGCLSGSGVPQTLALCADADQDTDGDVDQSDFGLLQRCITGPWVTARPDCARQ